ncbi:DNA polymerase delta catalytic subunit [Sphaeroforma arctica JP610]|uniref:DNA polymerase n=1 Tax=Sphaeroforma arctica JP610 TaxID=667725 RepID=A0A0L0GCE0_9EUKA|nr:DNA polymerase delta catalytic subunit [Sphaeroforma arctica JP610]KNC85933.1 DNA polymerase delta catalytic subunit [Sphaeroforma arctica JP610]|eukprot:XP_014159835.1 DNA polymerase delta catalytic subunit [Sphaeroforma arctica JP610]
MAGSDDVEAGAKRKQGSSQAQPNSKQAKMDAVKESTFEKELMELDAKSKASEGVVMQQWSRPSAKQIRPAAESFVFQQLDIDTYEGPHMHGMPGIHRNGVIFRLFGVNSNGNSVCAHVHGFLPYFYVPAPKDFKAQHVGIFMEAINAKITNLSPKVHNAVVRVEVEMKENIFGYHSQTKIQFLKLTMNLPHQIAAARRAVEQGFNVGVYGLVACQPFESNLEILLRFMVDTGIVGCSWVELPQGAYRIRGKTSNPPPQSRCQYEFDIAYDKLIAHAAEGEYSKNAPFRILSFDIECKGRPGVFPEADQDPIIQIANMVQLQGEERPFVRNIFCLKTCDNIAGSEVKTYHRHKTDLDNERELLQEWAEFLRAVDPDVITGYNTTNFDLPYLFKRAEKLNVKNFHYWGRIENTPSVMRDTQFSSKAYGTRDSHTFNIEGRVPFDVLQLLQRDYKLRSYSLNSVSAEFLGEQKEDVPHTIISDLQEGSDQTRRRLAVYCLKDAYLPLRLLNKLMGLINYIEMARVTGVPLNYLLTRGQQIKVVSQLYRRARVVDYVIPHVPSGQADEQYEGATVIEPNAGYYDTPITTLDFASLYPSIMMAHNLCYTTLIRGNPASLGLGPDDYIKTPTGDNFVKQSKLKGLLPDILEDLLTARKRAKLALKKETDPFKKAVLDGRQLALKISANSVYGFTGATVGKLPCLQISSSVTGFGRQMIEQTKQVVEDKYTIENGYVADAKVIYGDTDSVMIKFGTETLEEAMDMGKEAATFVSEKFVSPIKLEFEKVYFPYLLISKKRYAGLYWTRPDKYDKMDCKGIETVRRDNCHLVKNLIDRCLKFLLVERDLEGAKQHVKDTISLLLQNKVDISQLVISKALAKSSENYTAKQAHVELADRMRKRDAGSAPQLGDRVPYVIIKAAKKAAAYEKAEDPIYVLENNIPIDFQHYVEHQLTNPITRIFEPIMGVGKAQHLLKGDHTRKVSVLTPMTGGLMKFTKKVATCVSCKSRLPRDDLAICEHCKPHEGDILRREVDNMRDLEEKFSRLWSQCQRCQGSLHQDILCTSRDCPIFYMRSKVKQDLSVQQKVIDRFGDDW